MKSLNIREARRALWHLDEILEAEGELTITKRGKAIARVVQLRGEIRMPSHKALREKMPRMEQGSEKLVREDRGTTR